MYVLCAMCTLHNVYSTISIHFCSGFFSIEDSRLFHIKDSKNLKIETTLWSILSRAYKFSFINTKYFHVIYRWKYCWECDIKCLWSIKECNYYGETKYVLYFSLILYYSSKNTHAYMLIQIIISSRPGNLFEICISLALLNYLLHVIHMDLMYKYECYYQKYFMVFDVRRKWKWR